jgi:acyl carrier protein
MTNSTETALRGILESVLGPQALPDPLDDDALLLGAIPEIDSMAVIAVLTAIQETFDFTIADEEVSADMFETFGSLRRFVESRAT